MPEATENTTCPCGRQLALLGERLRGTCNGCDLIASAAPPGGDRPSGWPMLSDAMGVHPGQIEKAMAADKRLGVTIRYTSDGRAVYENQAQRAAHMKAHGFHDNRGGYRG